MQELPRSQNRIRRRPVTQVPREPAFIPEPAPKELTRDQYLEMLKTARKMHKVQAYLAMLAIFSAGVQPQELLAVTVEEVKTGEITTAERVIHLPDSLREELLACARRNGISSGAIFMDKIGTLPALSMVREQIKTVSRVAGFDDGLVSARTLQKLYETTWVELMTETVQQLMQEQLDKEQAEYGWES